MPIYEYVCAACGRVVEVIQWLSDPSPEVHAGCGGTLCRLVSAPSVRMKENDGLTGSMHSSTLRADDNYKAAKGTGRKTASTALPARRPRKSP